MDILINALFVAGIGHLIAYSRPTTSLIGQFLPLDDYDTYPTWKKWLQEFLTCAWCITFWTGLILTQSVYVAVIGSLIARYVDEQ